MAHPDEYDPAFPETRWDDKSGQEVQWTGMTLRDYFAAGAMNTFLQGAVMPNKEDRDKLLPFAAEVAYEVADAMLIQRTK